LPGVVWLRTVVRLKNKAGNAGWKAGGRLKARPYVILAHDLTGSRISDS
jgi:hypothetical protein